jgi:hypothetical protein
LKTKSSYPTTTGLQASYACISALLTTARDQLDGREYHELVELLIHLVAREAARRPGSVLA